MPRIRIPRPFAAIALAAAVACNADPVVLCACSVVPPYTVVYGHVTGPAGEAVAGARVHALVGPAGCGSAADSAHAPADAAGRYRLPVFATGADAEQCVRVTALAPAGSGLRAADTVRFAVATPRGFPADSVRRDVALRAP
ncbi:MAG: hypothetical protein KY467_10945 [Gemmatimonadetes bacterium]|nr:hypothetical protein [Gemmatimonadota bacterium]